MAQGSPELIAALGEINRCQPLGTSLFDAFAKVTVLIGVEAVCLRLNPENNKVEVYLTQRSADDTAYPREEHCPGSILRPTEDFSDVLNRLAEREFGGKILSARFVANCNHPREARGHFISVIYLCTLDETGKGLKGKWFPVDQLPENTVATHRHRIIPAAVGAFVAEHPEIYD